jgi:hypothetical protein
MSFWDMIRYSLMEVHPTFQGAMWFLIPDDSSPENVSRNKETSSSAAPLLKSHVSQDARKLSHLCNPRSTGKSAENRT